MNNALDRKLNQGNIAPSKVVSKREKSFNHTKKLVYMGLLVALTAALSQIAIPMPVGVPFTLQTFAVAFVAYFLGWKYGLATISIYIILGAVGAPVFSHFGGGVGRLISITGGYIWGFLPMAFFTGLFVEKKNAIISIIMGIIGLFCCHFLGVVQFHFVTGTEFTKCILLCSLPYLPKDILTTVLAFILAGTVKKRLKF